MREKSGWSVMPLALLILLFVLRIVWLFLLKLFYGVEIPLLALFAVPGYILPLVVAILALIGGQISVLGILNMVLAGVLLLWALAGNFIIAFLHISIPSFLSIPGIGFFSTIIGFFSNIRMYFSENILMNLVMLIYNVIVGIIGLFLYVSAMIAGAQSQSY